MVIVLSKAQTFAKGQVDMASVCTAYIHCDTSSRSVLKGVGGGSEETGVLGSTYATFSVGRSRSDFKGEIYSGGD